MDSETLLKRRVVLFLLQEVIRIVQAQAQRLLLMPQVARVTLTYGVMGQPAKALTSQIKVRTLLR
jgi:hypothetical protein